MLPNGAVILVDGGDGYMHTAIAMAKRLLRNMGCEYKGFVYCSGTNTISVNLWCGFQYHLASQS